VLLACSLYAQSTFFTPSLSTATAATPTFSPVAGTVADNTEVTISTVTSGCDANIYYTTDGSDPDSGDTNDTTVTITASMTVKAKVIGCSGYQDSAIGSAAYVVVEPPSDTFTGSAGTDISAHTADSGHTWTNRQGAAELDGSGEAQHVSEPNAFGAIYWSSWSPPSADYAVQLTVGGGLTDQYYLFARMTGTTSGYRCGYLGSGIGLRCTEYTGGSVTTIIGTAALASLVDGDVLRMEVTGTSIVFKRNGSTVISGTNASYSAAGSTGFSLRSGAKITAWSAE
jgi:hypothetical protein